MFTLEVPQIPIDPILVDPAYTTGEDLERWPTSLPVIKLGTVPDPEVFSALLDEPEQDHTWATRKGEAGVLYHWKSIRGGLDLAKAAVDFNKDEPPLEVNLGDNVTYQVPDSLRQFGGAILAIATHEHATYKTAQYKAISISTTQSTVGAGKQQRGPMGAHRDGFNIHRLHIYVVSDVNPTEFYPSPEPLRDDVVVDGSRVAVVADPYQIVYANRTTHHRSPIFEEAARRTFLRVTYEHARSPHQTT